MTPKEQNTIYKLCLYALIVVMAGLINLFSGYYEERTLIIAYYTLQQLSHIVLILCVYGLTTNFTIRTILEALIILSVAELFDEIVGNNLNFRLNDYALLLAALYIVVKRAKRNGRPKT